MVKCIGPWLIVCLFSFFEAHSQCTGFFNSSMKNAVIKKYEKVKKNRGGKLKYIVYLFVNDECPICRYYGKKIVYLDSVCSSKGIPMVLVFSGDYKKRDIKRFKKSFQLENVVSWRDKTYTIAKCLKASTTPEIMFISLEEEKVLYRGLIDDNFAALGERRFHVSHDYFLQAVEEYYKSGVITVPETKPIGCLMNYE